jgi:hypothetical protein
MLRQGVIVRRSATTSCRILRSPSEPGAE